MNSDPRQHYWRSPDERRGFLRTAPDSSADRAAAAEASGVSRRSFLSLAGFSFAAAAATGCSRAPTRTALALIQPDEVVVPGRSYWVASTSTACGAGCGVLVRCRDGRPVKLEGNPDHPVSRGGLCPSCQASVLSLYDDHRLKGPRDSLGERSGSDLDAALRARVAELAASGGRVRVLTGTLNGPSTLAAIDGFLGAFADGRHVMYDALSCSALLDAMQDCHGVRALPRYHLQTARVIASFDGDPLGVGVSPVEHTAGWRDGRDPDGHPAAMSRLWQLESRFSITGANADERLRVAPWEQGPALAALCFDLGKRAGVSLPFVAPQLPEHLSAPLSRLAEELWSQRGQSLVLAGRNDPTDQRLAALANHLLGNLGASVDLSAPSLQRRGDDRALLALRDELLAGQVDLLIVHGCNPAYDLPDMAGALSAAGTLVSTAALLDETSALAHWTCPEPHDLERWDDAEPVAGVFALQQPCLPRVRQTRTLRESLASWSGADDVDDRELLFAHWRNSVQPQGGGGPSFEAFMTATQQAGFVLLPSAHAAQPSAFRMAALQNLRFDEPLPGDEQLSLVLHARVGLLDGRGAHNPWLQELPDPVTKTTWGNEACVSPATAERLGLTDGQVVQLTAEDGAQLELPVLVQPGQHDGVISVALGQGRLGTDRFTDIGPQWLEGQPTVAPGGSVGVSAAPLLQLQATGLRFDGRAVRLKPTGREVALACTQDHHRMELPAHLAPKGAEVRDVVLSLPVSALLAGEALETAPAHGPDLWPDDHPHDGPRWGMSIDLAACTGCSACVVSCQAENNVPVVGRDEVVRHREMSWLRIDRYYTGDGDGLRAVHQPMMCQHCAQAPCETVCPVLATVHSREGLNAQVYNRCVGTRYCANNCPYKVRRFNWFEYAKEDRLQNMVLNPDVTVRSRGVMEKCSMCVQRILEARAAARRQGRELQDGDIQTACQQSCPSRAIVFGDLNDPESRVSLLRAANRRYEVLPELNVKPVVSYLAHVTSADHGPGGA